jgi:hypothetical protein
MYKNNIKWERFNMKLLDGICDVAKGGMTTATFNTNTLFDFMVGSSSKGIDGKWLINGGLTNTIMGIQGRNNTYKSTMGASLAMRTMGLYPEIEAVVVDTEDSLSRDHSRISRFSGEYNVDVENRIKFVSGAHNDINTVYGVIRHICDLKLKNKKELTIETPFIDDTTGKRMVSWIPTILFIDSISELYSKEEDDMLSDGGLDDKKNKTIYMVDGNKKTVFIRALRRYCEQYGILVIVTAHTGNNNANLDSYGPVSKQMQYMKQSDRIKNAGAKFEKLTIPLVQTMNPSILQDTEKKAMYKLNDITPDADINEIILSVQRCKGNIAGINIPFVVSQSNGLLNTVSNYHFLKSNNYYGLNGSKIKHQPSFLPSKTISRNSIRTDEASYEVRRALELSAQYCYLKQYWNTNAITEVDFSLSPIELYENINKSGSKWNDILNSRGHWAYNKDCTHGDREYMSIFDVLSLIKK